MIDLTQLMGIENKVLEKINKDVLMKKYKNVPIQSANNSLFFLSQLLIKLIN